ncbi:MAG: YeeE/YedE family protein [Bacteroidales bacterium]|nr:YeeE/YedE family protein [Bacteroidales bacterium]
MEKFKKGPKYRYPYLNGFLLGLTMLAAFYFSGHGLGASGAMKSCVVASVDAVAHQYAESSLFYSKYTGGEESPMKSWLVFEVLGVLLGGLLSGAMAGRLKWRVEKSPNITNKTRLWTALIGGILMGIGSQFGRGCASGAAMSGMAVMSLGGYVVMMSMFGTAFIIAFFVRKLWV